MKHNVRRTVAIIFKRTSRFQRFSCIRIQECGKQKALLVGKRVLLGNKRDDSIDKTTLFCIRSIDTGLGMYVNNAVYSEETQ